MLGLKPQLVARLSKVLKAEEIESIAAESLNEVIADESEVQVASNSSNEVLDSGSNDSMDIDMADIVIIDEYDSTKIDSKHDSSSKKVHNHKNNELFFRFEESFSTVLFAKSRVHRKKWTSVSIVGLKNGIVCPKIRKSSVIQRSTVQWINSPVR